MSVALPDMICFALYSATHAMQHVYKPLLDDLGLTYPQYLVMTALWAQDGQSVGALGRQLHLESNTLTPVLKRIEKQGLITRSRSSTDERQVMITLTPAGKDLAARAAHIPGCILDASGMTAEQLVALRDSITDLRDQLRDT